MEIKFKVEHHVGKNSYDQIECHDIDIMTDVMSRLMNEPNKLEIPSLRYVGRNIPDDLYKYIVDTQNKLLSFNRITLEITTAV